MKYFLFFVLTLLTACSGENTPNPTTWVTDQCLRAQIFQQCLAAVPRGPSATGGENPWDDIVSECERAAYYQAAREYHAVTPQCRVRR